jgi:hypothetical protein
VLKARRKDPGDERRQPIGKSLEDVHALIEASRKFDQQRSLVPAQTAITAGCLVRCS